MNASLDRPPHGNKSIRENDAGGWTLGVNHHSRSLMRRSGVVLQIVYHDVRMNIR